jgi:hypothetical protein
MDTVVRWSRDFLGQELLPACIERDYCALTEIIFVVEKCIGQEFGKDIKAFEQKYGHPPDTHERPFIHPPLYSYPNERKNRFTNCVKEKN